MAHFFSTTTLCYKATCKMKCIFAFLSMKLNSANNSRISWNSHLHNGILHTFNFLCRIKNVWNVKKNRFMKSLEMPRFLHEWESDYDFFKHYFFLFHFRGCKMDFKRAITIILCLLPFATSLEKCPSECVCSLDHTGRYQSVCDKGRLNWVYSFYWELLEWTMQKLF